MRKILFVALLPALSVPCMVLAQGVAPQTMSEIFAKGSAPTTVAQSLAELVKSDPSNSPGMVLEAVGTFAKALSGEDLENAVSEIFKALAEAAPESLVEAVAAVVEKYPALAVAVAEGASRGNPSLAREVTAAVLATAPETDQTALATAVADAATLSYPDVLGWFADPLGLSNLPTSAFPGGGGSSRPRPYSD